MIPELSPASTMSMAIAASTLIALSRRRALDVPEFCHCNAEISKLLLRLRTLRRGYATPLLVPSGLLQSALAESQPPPKEALPFVRDVIQLPPLNGASSRCCPAYVPLGIVSVDWLQQADENAPVCLLVPGLTGSSSSQYIRRVAVALHRAGVRVGVFNPRGRGGNELVSPFFYSAGYTEDLRRIVERVRAQYPNAPLHAAGYSLGASYLGKYVAEEGVACVLSGAALFACPTDLVSGIRRLATSFGSRLLDRRVLVPSVQRVMEGTARRSWTRPASIWRARRPPRRWRPSTAARSRR